MVDAAAGVALAVAEEEDVVAALATVIEEAVVVEVAAEAEMAEANKQIFLPALVTGNAPSSTVATPTLPGETTATNVNNPNQLAPEVVMITEVETAEEALEVAEAGVFGRGGGDRGGRGGGFGGGRGGGGFRGG